MYIALLRGINVGGKNKLPMRDLAEIFSEAACDNARTYIQSGNVVFHAAPATAERVSAVVSRALGDRFGIMVPIVLRTAAELAEAAAANPFLKSVTDTEALHVAFLADRPDRRNVASLDSARSPGDSFVVRGRDIYLHLPNGVARTKLTNAYFDSTLATTSTIRNWRTVQVLLEMTKA